MCTWGVALNDYKLDRITVVYADKNAYANCDSCVEYFAKVNKFKIVKIMDGAVITKEVESRIRKSKYSRFIYSEYLERVRTRKF